MKAYVLSRDGLDFVAEDRKDDDYYITELVEAAKWFDTYEAAENYLSDDCWRLLGRFHVYEVECTVKKAEVPK